MASTVTGGRASAGIGHAGQAPRAYASAAPAAQASAAAAADATTATAGAKDEEEAVLPLPNWLRRLYFIFPIVLYVPDAIFNFYVYSDGVNPPHASPVMQAAFFVLWGFVATGVVGMAYLLSVLAPWHWGQRHRLQAFFCGLGVIIATAITTWNSLAYRSISFQQFNTDQWIYSVWPQLKEAHFSITMVLVAVAPPFWGLFWAIVQPTQSNRHNLAQLQESHAERMVRIQQEAEVKRLRAETNATIREAQLRGMAQTAAAARAQVGGLITQGRKGDTAAVAAIGAPDGDAGQRALPAPAPTSGDLDASGESGESGEHVANITRLQPHAHGRESTSRPVFMNSVAPSAGPAVFAEPSTRAQSPSFAAQPAMFADVQGSMGVPASDVRRPPTFGGLGVLDEADEMTGTSGPRHRRPNEVSPLTNSVGKLPAAITQVINEIVTDLQPEYGKGKKIPRTRMVSELSERMSMSETDARRALDKYAEERHLQRAGNTPRR